MDSIHDVPGYLDQFQEAEERQNRVRAEAHFLNRIQLRLAGVPIRPLVLSDILLFDLSGSPVLNDDFHEVFAFNFLWILSTRNDPKGWGILKWINRRFNYFQAFYYAANHKSAGETCGEYIKREVKEYISDQLMDMPGRYGARKKKDHEFTQPPRINYITSVVSEVMESAHLSYHEIQSMPLSLFWQFLFVARSKQNPDYRGDQPTDIVNRNALKELNRIRKGLAR